MKKKVLSLPTNKDKIYRQILALLNFLLEITPQEREVLAELIKLNNEYEALPPKKRAKFILSTDMRKETRELLEIEEKHYNNIVARLKKKTFLGNPIMDQDNVIHQELLFKPDPQGFKVEINLYNQKQITKKQIDETIDEESTSIKTEKETEKINSEPAVVLTK
jgi:hypothetical protein